MSMPTANGANGRAGAGRFAKGNPGGPGNPHAKRAQEMRKAFYAAVSDEDLAEVVRALIREAKAGDVQAAREVLDRCLGKPEALDMIERLDALEELLEKRDIEERA